VLLLNDIYLFVDWGDLALKFKFLFLLWIRLKSDVFFRFGLVQAMMARLQLRQQEQVQMLAHPSLLLRTLHFLVAVLIPDQGVVIRRTGRRLVLLALR
jgi:hypothetical protein